MSEFIPIQPSHKDVEDDPIKAYKTITRNPLLIFDLDGTLVDCKGLHRWCFREAVTEINQDVKFSDSEVEGMPTRDKIEILKKKGYWIPNSVDALKQRYTMKHIEDYVKPNKELRDTIYALTKYYNVSLATNGRKEFVMKVLRIMDLWPWSSFLTPDYGPSKPDTWMFDQCMRSSFATSHTTIIFEDSPLGIKCAKNTGAFVAEVSGAENTLEKTKALLAYHESMEEDRVIDVQTAFDQIKSI